MYRAVSIPQSVQSCPYTTECTELSVYHTVYRAVSMPHSVQSCQYTTQCTELSVYHRVYRAVSILHSVQSCQYTTVWGDAWCNGLHVCFPSLPPMLLRTFDSRLGLESSGCGTWHFLKLVARGFLRLLRFPPLLHWCNGVNAISTLSNIIAELSFRTTWHVARHAARVCSRLRPGHLSVRVGDSSRRSEEIVKNPELRL